MAYLLAFTDACPQEFIAIDEPRIWHTMAGIATILEEDPFACGLLVPGLTGPKRVIRIPDPKGFASYLQPDAQIAFRSWKNIRTPKRKRKALDRLLKACSSGKCLFLSHSTVSDFAEGIAEKYLGTYCSAFVKKSIIIGHPEFVITIPPSEVPIFVNRQRIVSLTWIVHCLSVFLFKAREAYGNVDGLFVHDNLPFNREEDIAIVQALLNAQDPGRIHFLTEQRNFEFAPTDNLAATTNDFVTGRDSTIQSWVWKEGRPRNFYMTVDDGNGTFSRFI